MRLLKIVFIGMIVSIFLVGQAYSAPKGNNGNGNGNNGNANNGNGNNGNANNGNGNNGNANNGNGNNGNANNGNANNGNRNNGNANNGNSQAVRSNNRGNNNAASQTRGQAAVHRQQARRSSEANQRREERSRSADRNSIRNNGNSEIALNRRATRTNDRRGRGQEMRNERASNGRQLLDALDRARWSHNPHDTRGQGNMGNPDMQDPFGHDKDSDRKELYGNNGRPIRISDEDIEQHIASLEEMIAIDWQTEHEYLEIYRRLFDYYSSLLTGESLTEGQISQYSYLVNLWQVHIDYYESLTTTRIFLRGDATIDYTLSLDLPEGQEESTLLVSTSLVVSESFDTLVREYNEETGTWEYRTVHYEAGQVIDTVEEEAVINGDSSSYVFSYDPPGDLLEGNEWNSDGGFFDVVVNVTDTNTESSYTQTFDQSLYLYRDPYGNVEDAESGQAIAGAKITVFTDDGSIVALDKASNPTASNPQMTDATGRFGFNLRADRKYYMVASAPGYEDYESNVFTEQWHVIREDIKMVPEQEQMVSNIK